MEAREDTLHLIRLLERSHPDPYTPMGGKVAFKRAENKLLASIPSKGLSVPLFAELLRRFLAGLGDGHTHLASAGFPWMHPADALPVDFAVTTDGLVVSGHDIPAFKGTRGYRLRSLNGRTVDRLIEALSLHTAVENKYQGYAKLRHVITSPRLSSRILDGPKPDAPLRYELVGPNGRSTFRTVSASFRSRHRTGPVHLVGPGLWSVESQKDWMERPVLWRRKWTSHSPFFCRFQDNDSIAYFRVRTVMGREAYEMALKEKFGNPLEMIARFFAREKKKMPKDPERALLAIPSFLEPAVSLLESMKQKRTRTLIIDLGGNGGGVTPTVFPFLYMLFGDAFYGHRFPIEFVTVHSSLYLKKHNQSVARWRRRTKNPLFRPGDYSFRGGFGLLHPEKKTASARRQAHLSSLLRKKYSFAPRLDALGGKPSYTPRTIIVLCDAATFSAAFHFMFLLRHMGAHVVGIPSGQAPNAFMELTSFTLPVSGLAGNISNSAQIFMPEDPKARVFPVDHPVSYKILKRFRFASDSSLAYALHLAATGRISGFRKPPLSAHASGSGRRKR